VWPLHTTSVTRDLLFRPVDPSVFAPFRNCISPRARHMAQSPSSENACGICLDTVAERGKLNTCAHLYWCDNTPFPFP
jgi:hypothetical protein